MKKILLMLGLVALLATPIFAQGLYTFKQTTYPTLLSDTVTNTATNFLQSPSVPSGAYVTVQVVVTKISGTVGGTISLQGSVDGTNWKALNTAETQTALATITATDASNVYHWRLSSNPFSKYRVTWTGTGTMAASFTAQLLTR